MTVPEYESLRERYLKFFPDSPFAANVEGYEEGGYILDDKGNFIHSPIEMDIECGGISCVVPFLCGCGRPEYVALVFHQTLCWCGMDHFAKFSSPIVPNGWMPMWKDHKFDYGEPVEILFDTMLYLANDLGYADHGTSIYGSWLTDKGCFVRDVLGAYLEIELGKCESQ